MATDFNPNNTTILVSGALRPTIKDVPIDIRTRIETLADMTTIPMPFVGMIVFVKDINKFYKVEKLNSTQTKVETEANGGFKPLLDEEVATIIANLISSGSIKTELDKKADKINTYTKAEVNALIDSVSAGDVDLTNYYTKTETDNKLNLKVDKVSGKQLSTEDFTTTEKNKLANLQNADVTKSYVDTELAKKLNSAGHVLTDNNYTTAEKTKLAGLNNYTHPTTSGNKHIPSGGTTGQILKWESDGVARWMDDTSGSLTPEQEIEISKIPSLTTKSEKALYFGESIVGSVEVENNVLGKIDEIKNTEIPRINTQLDHKMNSNTTNISISQINKNLGKIDQSFLTDTLLQQIAGTTPINAVPTDNSITRNKLTNGIMADFLSDVTVKENLIDKSKFSIGGLSSDGTVNTLVTQNYVTDFISIESSKLYYRKNTNAVVVGYYDINKVFISRPTIAVDVASFTTPTNAKYMRYTDVKESMDTEVLSRFTINGYISYTTTPKILFGDTYYISVDDKISKNSITYDKMSSNMVPTFIEDVYAVQNLIDKSKFTVGGLSSDGTVNTLVTQNYITDFIPIESDMVYYRLNKNLVVVAYYDSNKTFISRPAIAVDVASFTTPTNAKYIRYTDKKTSMETEVIATFPISIYVDYTPSKVYILGDKWKVKNQSTTPTEPTTGTYVSKLKGKNLICFGDSITFGAGASSGKNYPAMIQAKYGLNVVNKGISGASWANYGDGNDNISVLTQIQSADFTNADFVTIFAGTNDFGRGGRPMGNVGDTVENTMRGAINLAIERIIKANPKIKIAIITPMWRQRLSAGDDKDSDFNQLNGFYLKDYVNAIIENAKYNHIPVYNFYDNCLINKHNYLTFLGDGLHPNDIGYELLADMIHSFLEKTY